jgi:hypothetical protein
LEKKEWRRKDNARAISKGPNALTLPFLYKGATTIPAMWNHMAEREVFDDMIDGGWRVTFL